MEIRTVCLSFAVLVMVLPLYRCSEPHWTPGSERHQRSDRGGAFAGRSRACEILFAIDEPLWKLKGENMTEMVDMAQRLVFGLNRIFVDQVFVGPYSDIYFRLGRVQVVFGSCEGPDFFNCTQQRGLFLNSFDEPRDFSEFCIAHLFTYVDFHNGTAGLANIGTACRRFHNSAFVTLLNFGVERSFNETLITFAHEVAHNFNAPHDEDMAEERPECAEGGWIMSKSFDVGSDESPKFSPCSIDKMTELLSSLNDEGNDLICFKKIDPEEKEPETALCGNGIVEPGEECDCGVDDVYCHDRCCYPAHVDAYDRENYRKAVSCTKHDKPLCVTPVPLVYGFYLPFGAILAGVLCTAFILNRDWKGEKRLYKHVTEGNVRIIRPGAKASETQNGPGP